MICTRRTLAVGLSLFLAACASKEATRESAPSSAASESVSVTGDERQSAAEQESDERGPVGVDHLVQSLNTFAFDLYRSVRTDQFVVSPYGVATVLAIAQAGSGGETSRQINQTLRIPFSEAEIHPRFRQLHDALRTRATPRSRDAGRGFRLRSQSGVWTSDQISPGTAFLRTAHNQHDATMERFDFASDPDAARDAINKYVQDGTAGRVDHILATSNPLSRVILTNTVVWDAPWALPFAHGSKEFADFASPEGARRVPMMRARVRVGYLDGDGFQLVELPYGDGDVAAWVILPDEGQVDFDAGLTADYFAWMVQNARQHDVEIHLPRFEVNTRHSLRATLSMMGVTDAFDPQRANLSPLSPPDPNHPVFVDDVVHVAQISVDEDGSNAAAALGGTVPAAGAKLPQFEASRPFLVIVRDAPTGVILAMARVSAP